MSDYIHCFPGSICQAYHCVAGEAINLKGLLAYKVTLALPGSHHALARGQPLEHGGGGPNKLLSQSGCSPLPQPGPVITEEFTITQGLTMASAEPEPCQRKNKALRALPNTGPERPAVSGGMVLLFLSHRFDSSNLLLSIQRLTNCDLGVIKEGDRIKIKLQVAKNE